MNIVVVGAGYVGLVTAACFAEVGNQVTVLEIDLKKILHLQQGDIPFYEPGLKELVKRNIQAERLFFTHSYKDAIPHADLCFFAVPTPSDEDGSCDTKYLLQAASSVAKYMQGPLLLINKSTVPVGTAQKVKAHVQKTLNERHCSYPFSVLSNPEFLKEGSALQDFQKPERIIVGVDNDEAAKVMKTLYQPFNKNRSRLFITNIPSAELIKYAANAMLALRISFMNELSRISEACGADIETIRQGLGSDSRIGSQFLYAGVGFGGSCFPKDLNALLFTSQQLNIETDILPAISQANQKQKEFFLNKILDSFSEGEGLQDKTLAIWGLSFKPQTDDIREAPSLFYLQELLKRGAQLRVFDPIVKQEAHPLFSHSNLTFCSEQYTTCENADALILLTEWSSFRFPDFQRLSSLLKNRVIFDGRNQYTFSQLEGFDFTYYSVGKEPFFSIYNEIEHLV